MPISAGDAVASVYLVEVSGWDSKQSFFVEKAELEWDEVTGKHLRLTRLLCPGTMIFVRLVQATSPDCSFPVAYQAEHLATTADGLQQFRLNLVQPRLGARDPSQE